MTASRMASLPVQITNCSYVNLCKPHFKTLQSLVSAKQTAYRRQRTMYHENDAFEKVQDFNSK